MPHFVNLVRLACFLLNFVRLRKISPIGRLGKCLTCCRFFPKHECLIDRNLQQAKYLNNGHFHLVKGHELAREALRLVNDTYDSRKNHRGQSGPEKMGEAFKRLYGLRHITNTKIISQRSQSSSKSLKVSRSNLEEAEQ